LSRIAKAHLRWAFFLTALFATDFAIATPLFESSTVLEVRLTGPLRELIRNKHAREERPFTLTVDGIEHDVQVRARGNSRLRVCKFPPLRLNFPSSTPEHSIFAGQDKLKLVTHCSNNSRGEKDALEEYAAYRIFNQLEDASYRVRLVKFTYVDTSGKGREKVIERYGFVLESLSELSQRIAAEPANLKGIPVSRYDERQAAIVYVFQYLIGNTDWSLVRADYDEWCCHNIELLEKVDKQKDDNLLLVPYDFDLAGLVNARYAYPDPLLPIKKVTHRLYRGKCMEREPLQAGLGAIRDRREDILGALGSVPGLSEHDIESGNRYLHGFFKKAEDEEKLLKIFEMRCK